MIFTILTDYRDNKTSAKTFYSIDEYHTFTFCPLIMTDFLLDTNRCPYGKTYKEKKEWLKEKAIELSNYDYHKISWIEFLNLTDYFSRHGKKYGLLKEFRENGIC